MTANKNLSGGTLTEFSAPALSKQTGGGSASVPQPNAIAAIANAAVDLAPLGLKLWEKSQTDSLNEELSGKLLTISQGRQTGQFSSAQAETRYRQTILEYKRTNPDYNDEINAISMATIGRNPIREAEKAAGDQNIMAAQLGRLLDPNTTDEQSAIEKGYSAIADAKQTEMNLKKAQANGAAREQLTTQFSNDQQSVGSVALSNRLTPVMDQLFELGNSVNTVGSASQFNNILAEADQTLTVFKNGYLETVEANARALNEKSSLNINIEDSVKTAREYIDGRIKIFRDGIENARKNGYFGQLKQTIEGLQGAAELNMIEAMPIASSLMATFGAEVVRNVLTPSNMKDLNPRIIREIQSLSFDATSLGEQSTQVRTNTLQTIVETLKGNYSVEDLQSKEGRGEIFKALGATVQTYLTKPEPDKYPQQEDAFLNASASLMGVAAGSRVRTEQNIERVTGYVGDAFVDRLAKAKDQGKADMIADTAVNVLFKENVILSDNLKGGTGELSNVAEFDVASGKMKLRELTLDDLTDQQRGRLSYIKRDLGAEPTQSELWQAAGVSQDAYQKRVAKWNDNVRKQYMFSQYSPSMQKAGNFNTWTQMMAAKSGISTVKGQAYSDKLPSIISEGDNDIQQRMNATLPGYVDVSASLAGIRKDLTTDMLFNRDAKLKALKEQRVGNSEPTEENTAVPRIKIGF